MKASTSITQFVRDEPVEISAHVNPGRNGEAFASIQIGSMSILVDMCTWANFNEKLVHELCIVDREIRALYAAKFACPLPK